MLLGRGLLLCFASLGLLARARPSPRQDSYINPVLPGWHSDPSCIQKDGTFFCVTSTFIAFPGLPVYASKDLINWKLISHVWNRESQLPGISWETVVQQDGMYAPTIRYRDGQFYVICEYLGITGGNIGVLFKTEDLFDDAQWSDPVIFRPNHIDPDLFWDDDGKVYMATHGVTLQELDLDTGELSEELNIWNGTGGVWPEGPHIYKKDGWYYLMIAEGGTGPDHSITIARARSVTGPYAAYENNPILTNRGTDEWFQTVGHGDLFQDTKGNWWGLCLATRTGPSFDISPMGREAVLFNATWGKGEWPVLQPVRGRMPGSKLPLENRNVGGRGPFVLDDDDYSFEQGTSIPSHLIHHRVPRDGAFAVTARGLEVTPSRNNVTGKLGSESEIELSGQRGLSFIGRRQTHTLFKFRVDLAFSPEEDDQEAGVTVFRTQLDHIDLGVVRLSQSRLAFRLRAEGPSSVPETTIVPVPEDWKNGPIQLQVEAANATHYELSAAPVGDPEARKIIGAVSAKVVSFGEGSFVGSLVGVFATCNGAGSGLDCPGGGKAYFTNWTYTGIAQQISEDEFSYT
ncbi:hypothetical protein QQZ08_009877 [Neonectria magnoliae]|uniref:Beta-xylosidase C-terminal Concanavalin A-like domain-containing protein n=1 Tax=Neonectria magnoliae TaxID=2732573 RepID=A0ABR1HKF4_9HYPO